MTLDVLNAFVQHAMPESINGKWATLKIRRTLVDMLCKIALEACKDFVTCDNINNKIFAC